MFPPSSPYSQTGRAPGFEAYTGKPDYVVVLRLKPPNCPSALDHHMTTISTGSQSMGLIIT